ncbi:MAG: type II toxin-antitoxin system VapC family toxin [Candidatus Lokiarchaeota archaeon]|nr:type II toxin-antitoxin system VapC family toxin [Candidatus Lokiarchaeota archaeon]
MIYADTDFFLALLKSSDWLKNNAERIKMEHEGDIVTSEPTFIELMLICKRFNLDPIKLSGAVMAICNIDDDVYLKAARNVLKGGNVFDSFHAAHCNGTIISSDDVFEKLFSLKRIPLESNPNP